MKQKIVLSLLLLCLCSLGHAADGLRIEPFEIQAGETEKVNLILDDAEGIYCGIEFWLYLPQGISISKNTRGKFVYTPSENAEDHNFNIKQEADGSYHFLIQEAGNAFFGDGVFCTLTLEAATSAMPGTVTGMLKDVVLADNMGHGPDFKEIPFTVTIKAAEPVTIPVTIGNTGYATLYYATKALTVPEGVAAYVVTQDDIDSSFDGWTASYAAGSVIPADEAVVLKGETGEYSFVEAATTAEPVTGNLLRGYDPATDASATTTAPAEGDYRYYMLSTNANGQNAGFYYANDEGTAFECMAHKAYLALPAAASVRSYPFNAGQDSGVGIIHYQLSVINYFDLKGRKFSGRPMKKGIYIRNGRKEVVR